MRKFIKFDIETSHEIVIKYDLLLNMNLISSLGKFRAIRLWVWPTKAGRKWISKNILKYFWIHPLVLRGFFQKMGKQIESSLLHIFYYILQYTITPSLTKRFEMMVTATIGKNLGPPLSKQNDDPCLQEDQKPYSTCTFLCPVKLKLRISNFFLHLVDITLYSFTV